LDPQTQTTVRAVALQAALYAWLAAKLKPVLRQQQRGALCLQQQLLVGCLGAAIQLNSLVPWVPAHAAGANGDRVGSKALNAHLTLKLDHLAVVDHGAVAGQHAIERLAIDMNLAP
jgi:hypothetical protein